MNTRIEQNIKEKIKGKVLYNEPMRKHTSFCIGGCADIWIEPADLDDLRESIQLSRNEELPLFIIGNGTNLLVSDKGVRGIVINMLSRSLKNIYMDNHSIKATSAVTLREFLNFCRNQNLGGLEFLAGIPGSIGGAVMTNAGARHYAKMEEWHSIGDFIEEITIMKHDGKKDVLNKKELTFDYKSLDLADCIILEVKFLLTKTARGDILGESQKFLKRKKETQELNLPSAGCIFKNPAGSIKSAGQLIDECNLKGMRIGGAAISEKHANFIVNTGNASSHDVMALIDIVKEKVKNRLDLELPLEIRIV